MYFASTHLQFFWHTAKTVLVLKNSLFQVKLPKQNKLDLFHQLQYFYKYYLLIVFQFLFCQKFNGIYRCT